MKYLASTLGIAVALCASRADSQTFTTLVQFTGTSGTASGWDPQGSLAVSGTTLYGMTLYGGTNTTVISGGTYGYGNIFSVGVDGTNYQNLLSFTGTGGAANGAESRRKLDSRRYNALRHDLARRHPGDLATSSASAADGTNYQNLISFSGSGGTASGKCSIYQQLDAGGTTLYGMTELAVQHLFGQHLQRWHGRHQLPEPRFLHRQRGHGDRRASVRQLDGRRHDTLRPDELGWLQRCGNIFRVGTDGTSFQNLVSFPGGTQSAPAKLPTAA